MAEWKIEESPTVEASLSEPYTQSKEFHDVSVRLEVAEVTGNREHLAEFISGSFTAAHVEDTEAFRSSAHATEYSVFANDEEVIDGGERALVGWLETTLLEEVGLVQRKKELLLEAGFDEESLNELARELDDNIVDFYTGLHVTDAEEHMRSIALNMVSPIESREDSHGVPTPSETKDWFEEAQNKLNRAQKALDSMRETFEEHVEVPEPFTGTEEYPTNIDTIESRIQSSSKHPQLYAKREEKLPGDRKLVIEPGPRAYIVRIRDGIMEGEVVAQADTPEEAIKRFNQRYLEEQE